MILPHVYYVPGDAPTDFYVSVVKTTTHTFTLLAIAHARDTTWPPHDWDLEGVLIIEGRAGFEGMFAQAHFDWTPWAGAVRLWNGKPVKPAVMDGGPCVWIEKGGHGIYGEPRADATDHGYYEIKQMSELDPKLFVQNDHGRWMRGGAHAPWSWAERIGYPGLVAFDPVRFILESGVQGFSPLSSQYTVNEFVGIGEKA